MTEKEILNADGSRNFQANILLDNIKRLEFENKILKADYEANEQENAELKAENERLKEEFRIESLTDKTTGETIYRSNLVNKYRIILQEIKEIADAKCNECKYGKDGISCKYGDCGEAKLHLITQLITKAEEE